MVFFYMTCFMGDYRLKLLPRECLQQGRSDQQVSISAEQNLDGGGHLTILIEKDFACLAPRDGEDESDMFPNPTQGN